MPIICSTKEENAYRFNECTDILIVVAKNKKKHDHMKKSLFGFSDEERFSLKVTTVMAAVTLFLLWIFYYLMPDPVAVTLCAGALGGFLHEFIQSKGMILFIQRKDDGIYLGSISGLILGLVAGILIYGGSIYGIIPNSANPASWNPVNMFQIQASPDGQDNQLMQRLLFEALIAGVALKGISEAVPSPAKLKDDFDIVSVDYRTGEPSEASNNKHIVVTIKNNMDQKLEVQSIVLMDVENNFSVTVTRTSSLEKEDSLKKEEWTIPEKSTLSKRVEYNWLPSSKEDYKHYKITAISNNGQVEVSTTAPTTTSDSTAKPVSDSNERSAV
jgi:hypothetical protein